MNIIKQWYCRQCHRTLERKLFPRYFDKNTPCKACQAGSTPATPTDAAAQEQQVYVHRRGFNRRHARDNRETGE